MLNRLKYFVKKYLFNNTSPILLYHSVENEEKISTFPDIHNVEPSIFVEQIEFVRQSHDFVFVDEFFERIKKNKSLKGLACLTFDDGYKSILTNCSSYLDKRNIPYTIFLNKRAVCGSLLWRDMIRIVIQQNSEEDFLEFAGLKDKIDVSSFYRQTKKNEVRSQEIASTLEGFFKKKGVQVAHNLYLNIDDIKALLETENIMIGNHTVNHFVLSDLNKKELEIEITKNHKFLLNHFHEEKISKVFCIPFGGEETYSVTEVSEILQKLNYRGFLRTGATPYTTIPDLVNQEHIVSYARILPKNVKFSKNL